MTSLWSRIRAMSGIALRQLRHERMRTVLAIIGVAMAVLASVMLAGVGLGVVETGQQKFDQSDRDLWVTGGPVELRPGTVGGFENSLVGAHALAADIGQREDVSTAVPIAFQTVYASANRSEFETIVGVGAPARGPSVRITAGRGVQQRDTHYAGGTYDGPMQREVVLDQRAANLLDVSVNDTVSLGGTLATAREQQFRVVGISPTYSQFVGAPTVTLPLSELQEITGTTASDRATFITVALRGDADVNTVERELADEYPEYTIRTNKEQLQATLEGQALVIVSGAGLVALAVVAGVLLVINLQLSFVARHREVFAAIMATGTSRSSLAAIVSVHTLLIGALGGALGVGLAVPGTTVVNTIAASVTGFEGVATLSRRVLVGGLGTAIVVSVLAGLLASLYLVRMKPLEQLR